MKLDKYSGNPILSRNEKNDWESPVGFNLGAWYEKGKFYLLYRAAGDDDEEQYFEIYY